MPSVVILSVIYAKCRKTVHCAEVECNYAEYLYAECRSTECDYAECRDAVNGKFTVEIPLY
jgi:hypothetical protein